MDKNSVKNVGHFGFPMVKKEDGGKPQGRANQNNQAENTEELHSHTMELQMQTIGHHDGCRNG